MREISAQVEIDASPKRIWDVLTDFPAYRDWNPFMTEVRGTADPNAELEITMRRRGGHRLRFRARVLVADAPRELTWMGIGARAHWPGLVRGERRVTIEPIGQGRSSLRMRTRFTGLLSPLMRWLDAYRPAFDEMEQALKRRAEEGTGEAG